MGQDEGNRLYQDAAGLIQSVGITGEFTVTPLPGGANNRLFRIDTKDRPLLLKAYFHHPADPRDRLAAEFGFSTFAWKAGVRCLPQPLAQSPGKHMALYEFVEGRTFAPRDVTAVAVDAAARFFVELNTHRHETEARQLSRGSEACFSMDAHVQLVGRRVRQLEGIDPNTDIDREALAFVRDTLTPKWLGLCASPEAFTDSDRCLSPSDFGFHNALISGERARIVFLDFEYAGWDDPARMVCDFFCQPARPVSVSHFPSFRTSISSVTEHPSRFHQRIELLFPIYQIKWCCIMLNDFLPTGNLRRSYATGSSDTNERKTRQLAKAIAFLSST